MPATRLRAGRPKHLWAFDFQFDQTADGRALRLCNIVDEFTCEALVMLVARSIDADRTVSHSPWQNPFVEAFHSHVRDELLNVEEFACLAGARVVIEDWREDYNRHRPHSSLGMRAPCRVRPPSGLRASRHWRRDRPDGVSTGARAATAARH